MKLQKRDLNIYTAYTAIHVVIDDMQTLRADVDERFDAWYQEVCEMAASLGAEKNIRRVCSGASIFRATHPSEKTKQYYKRAVAIPFINDLNHQLKERFPENVTKIQLTVWQYMKTTFHGTGVFRQSYRSIVDASSQVKKSLTLLTRHWHIAPRTCFLTFTQFFKSVDYYPLPFVRLNDHFLPFAERRRHSNRRWVLSG